MELKKESHLERNGRDELLEGHAQFQNIDSVGVLKLLLCGRHWTELKESDTNKTSRMLDSVQKGKLQHWKQECVNNIWGEQWDIGYGMNRTNREADQHITMLGWVSEKSLRPEQ